MVPIIWDTSESAQANDSLGRPASACALRIRDSLTGVDYQIRHEVSRRVDSATAAGSTPVWEQVGDYARIPTGPEHGLASSWVRVECGSWKVIGLVPAERGGAAGP